MSQPRGLFTYRTLLVERTPDGYIATVTLNRPDLMNAMNTAMGEDLRLLPPQPGPRGVVVIFTGAGDAFCAGGDLKERNG
jgi:enoyl-CoA hydratase/carnithine racemase